MVFGVDRLGRRRIAKIPSKYSRKSFMSTTNGSIVLLLACSTYLYDEEELSTSEIQHKPHINKVIFLGLVARPWFSARANRNFCGKLVIFPFVEQRSAQCSACWDHEDLSRRSPTVVHKTKLLFKYDIIHYYNI